MTRGIRFLFNDAAAPPPESGGIFTLAIRTDARHATAHLKEKLRQHCALENPGDPILERDIERSVHDAYRTWGHNVLEAVAECLDYDRYSLKNSNDNTLDIHFYDSHSLAAKAIEKADHLSDKVKRGAALPTVYVSLDDMIEKKGDTWREIAFSRLFDAGSSEHAGYAPRPGAPPLDEQIREVKNLLDDLKKKHGAKIPFVLIEDNVRYARMPNWVINKLDEQNVFDSGVLAGISTCFCCASEKERAALQYNGQEIPLSVVVDYKDSAVDIITPRDLVFDGFVVDVNGRKARLPGIFMDVEKLFKIHPDKARSFEKRIREENKRFFGTLEKEFGIAIPLSWLSSAEAVSHVTGLTPDTRVIDALDYKDSRGGGGYPGNRRP